MVVSRFRQSITFQSPPASGVDAFGDLSGDWTNEATRRAEVKQLNGRQLESAQQLYGSVQWVVRFWYEAALAITDNWRISWGTKTLAIGNINNVDEQNRIYELLCSEVVD